MTILISSGDVVAGIVASLFMSIFPLRLTVYSKKVNKLKDIWTKRRTKLNDSIIAEIEKGKDADKEYIFNSIAELSSLYGATISNLKKIEDRMEQFITFDIICIAFIIVDVLAYGMFIWSFIFEFSFVMCLLDLYLFLGDVRSLSVIRKRLERLPKG